jgi:hypothetical protein
MAQTITRSITGRNVPVSLSPDQLDTLIDALDSVHQPHISQEFHDSLRVLLSLAYDRSQGA